MSEPLPVFRHHPDPVGTGSVVVSSDVCQRCGLARGYVYKGPTYAVAEIESLCPWCIADGTAAEEFGASFTTTDGAPADVPVGVLDEVEHRTPGFAGWQQERWLFHHADACEYLGRVGWDDVSEIPGVAAMLVADGWPANVHHTLSVDGDITGYLFRCRHCGARLVYADSS
jgi:uncharacterized protein CbrC (UPF0167 family)